MGTTLRESVTVGQGDEAQDESGGGDESRQRRSISVGKALRLLDTFGGMGNIFGVSELARRSGLAKSTVFRLATQLTESGYLMRVGSEYRLSLHTFSLGNRYEHDRSRGLRELAAPYLGELFLKTGYIVSLAVLDGREVVHLEKLQSMRVGAITPAVAGGRSAPSVTALGKVLLAFSDSTTVHAVMSEPLPAATVNSITDPRHFVAELEAVRRAGIAVDQQEFSPGLMCVAAAVLVDGRPRAAVSVSGPLGAFDPPVTGEHVQLAARGIAVNLVYERKRALAAI